MPSIGSARKFSVAAFFLMALFASLFGATPQVRADWPKSVTLRNLNVTWNTPGDYFGLLYSKGYGNLSLSSLKLDRVTSFPYASYNILYKGSVKSNFFNLQVTGAKVVSYDEKTGQPIYANYKYSEVGKEATVYFKVRNYDSKNEKKYYKIEIQVKTDGQVIGGYPSDVSNYTGGQYISNIDVPQKDYFYDSQYTDQVEIKSPATCSGIDGNATGKIIFDDDFHVETMPVIMRNIGVETSNMAWYTAASYWDKWFKGPPSVYKFPLAKYPFDWSSKNVLLPLSWIESTAANTDRFGLPSSRVPKAEKSFQDIKSKSFYASPNAIKAIVQNLQRDYNISQAKDGATFPLSKTVLKNGMAVSEKIFGDYSQKSLVVSMGSKDGFPLVAINIDPLAVMLNGFNFYMVPIGTAKVKKGMIYIDIQKIAYFVVDGFEFTDWEKSGDFQIPSTSGESTFYGYWALPNSIWPVYNGNYGIWNETFRYYRKHKKLGMDYLVVSDIKVEDAKYRSVPLTFPQLLVPVV